MKEKIITAWAETCSGPGWSNRLVWVIRQDANGKLVRDAIQSKDMNPQLRALIRISEEVNSAMVHAVLFQEGE